VATTTTRTLPPASAGDLARRTTVGVLVAVLAALVVRGVVDAAGVDVGAAGAMDPFATPAIVGSAVVAGAGAAAVYAALVRLTASPTRNFLVVAAAVFLAMLLPVALVAPGLGVTATGQVVLAVLHIAVAVPLVAFVTGAVRG
jgi:hypothetical protein